MSSVTAVKNRRRHRYRRPARRRRRQAAQPRSARASRRNRCTCRGRISWTGCSHRSDRTAPVLRSLQQLFGHGRLAGTGYLSILPVDQGIEHSAGASFAKNPAYFDPENIVKLAIEGGCNAVASTLGVLGSCSRKYAHKIPFLLKFNHNEFLTYPNKYDQIFFAQHQAGARHGRGRGRRDDLFRLRRIGAADRRGEQGVRDGARDGHGHGAVVLPAQSGASRPTRTITSPPT